MSEILFVVKTLLITAAVTMLMQVRWGGSSLEDRATHWLQGSATAEWVQGAASGGALAITHFARRMKDAVTDASSSEGNEARVQRASR